MYIVCYKSISFCHHGCFANDQLHNSCLSPIAKIIRGERVNDLEETKHKSLHLMETLSTVFFPERNCDL